MWDETLTGPIGLIAEYSFLKELEVVKMWQLKPGRLPPISVTNIIFITRPEVALMDCIAENLHRYGITYNPPLNMQFDSFHLEIVKKIKGKQAAKSTSSSLFLGEAPFVNKD